MATPTKKTLFIAKKNENSSICYVLFSITDELGLLEAAASILGMFGFSFCYKPGKEKIN